MDTPPQRSWAALVHAGRRRIRVFRRPIYIVWLSLLAVIFFSFTFSINRLYAQKQRYLSVHWFQQGQDALGNDKPQEAISDLRTALLYSHDNPQYLFTLAQALAAADRLAEARSYFLSMLEDEPGNGRVNLQLAHLAEKENDVDNAVRYLNGAIYGGWDSDPILKRQQVRQELIGFLISKGLKTQARGELLTYTTEMPKNSNSQLWVAQAFSRLGDDRSALDFYKTGLRSNRRDVSALLGAARSAFHLERYSEALEYFKAADEIHEDPATSQMVQLVSTVIELNPFESRISADERRHRLVLAMDVADHRLQQCAQAQNIDLKTVGGNPLQLARARWMYVDRRIRQARRDADLVQLLAPTATLITTVEQQDGCGPANASDQAMLRIYQNAEELQQ
jgi:tetratricopeptide (TPR) repeat protein